ncbi:hypothetical protein FEF26_04300 [Nesterenkonia salmonea]|uniref:Uncharacterized protein n=1 Tax=Nesterenkonia salmonea TaxID=1804987 RepID=A0A5R9BDB6_9MICC|nr:hypothetical protein [Nesterenkonia salmonea]TLP98625.1 hypothetical protein FEF26_04300 [Nesterenkonia salmonea]
MRKTLRFHYHRGSAIQAMRRYEVNNEIWGKGFKSHSLHKTAITSVERDQGLTAASQQGGHSNEITTKKFYVAPSTPTIDYTDSLQKLSTWTPGCSPTQRSKFSPNLTLDGTLVIAVLNKIADQHCDGFELDGYESSESIAIFKRESTTRGLWRSMSNRTAS